MTIPVSSHHASADLIPLLCHSKLEFQFGISKLNQSCSEFEPLKCFLSLDFFRFPAANQLFTEESSDATRLEPKSISNRDSLSCKHHHYRDSVVLESLPRIVSIVQIRCLERPLSEILADVLAGKFRSSGARVWRMRKPKRDPPCQTQLMSSKWFLLLMLFPVLLFCVLVGNIRRVIRMYNPPFQAFEWPAIKSDRSSESYQCQLWLSALSACHSVRHSTWHPIQHSTQLQPQKLSARPNGLLVIHRIAPAKGTNRTVTLSESSPLMCATVEAIRGRLILFEDFNLKSPLLKFFPSKSILTFAPGTSIRPNPKSKHSRTLSLSPVC